MYELILFYIQYTFSLCTTFTSSFYIITVTMVKYQNIFTVNISIFFFIFIPRASEINIIYPLLVLLAFNVFITIFSLYIHC